MNKKIFIYIFFLVPILCTSCEWFNESEIKDNKTVKTIEVFPDSVRKYLIEQDSLKNELISKIDTLTTELNASKKDIKQLQSDIKELRSPSKVLIILALCSLFFSITAVILSMIRTNKKAEKWEVEDMTRQLSKKNQDLEFRMTRAECSISGIGKNSAPTNSSFDKRLSDLDVRLGRLERINNTPSSNCFSYDKQSYNKQNDKYSAPDTIVVQEPAYTRIGYAKVNSSKYFVEIYSSQQEDCVYKINFINKDEGEFDIISLSKIKTINDLKEVLDFADGSCLLNEATSHKVVEKGRCKKIDENTWEVTKKLVIKVFK